MKRDQARLLADTRLSPAAVVLGLRISALGAGEHRLDADQLSAMLQRSPSRNTVSALIRELRLHGYVDQVQGGGNGRGAAYQWLGGNPIPAQPVVQESSEEASGGPILHNTLGMNGNHAQPIGQEGVHAHHTVQEAPSRARAAVGGGEGVVVNPPVVPPVVEDAETAIANNEILAGCRGAMRDYLRQRVPQHRQVGFVWSAVGWLNSNGFAWLNDEGTLTPPDVRPGLLANALNQLLASDEKGYKAPVGDPRNLLQKLRIICGQHGIERKSNGHREPASGAGTGRGGNGGTPAAAGAGKGGRIFTEYTPGSPHGPTGNGA